MTTVLEVDHLSVVFGANRVLRDLSFRVAEGECLAVIGPNGSGKTVLFKALIGALPLSGRIAWAPSVTIGYVPQKLDIERDLPITGSDFLRAKTTVAKSPQEEIGRIVELVNLSQEAVRQPIGTLSGGQFQRLLLAFALLGRPQVLLFDEPTAGVDEPGEEAIYTMLRRLQKEQRLTLLLISHELSLVYRYATSVLCLSRWRTCFGAPVDILTPERLREVYGTETRFHIHDGISG
ncbi:MAG TPA: metal ABC transporter ATP-binding protein [Gemmatimonadales bacterium]